MTWAVLGQIAGAIVKGATVAGKGAAVAGKAVAGTAAEAGQALAGGAKAAAGKVASGAKAAGGAAGEMVGEVLTGGVDKAVIGPKTLGGTIGREAGTKVAQAAINETGLGTLQNLLNIVSPQGTATTASQATGKVAPEKILETTMGAGVKDTSRPVTRTPVQQKQPGIFGDTKTESVLNFLQSALTSQTNIPTPGSIEVGRRGQQFTQSLEAGSIGLKEELKTKQLQNLLKVVQNIKPYKGGQRGSSQSPPSAQAGQVSGQPSEQSPQGQFTPEELQQLVVRGQLKKDYGVEIPETPQQRTRRINEEEVERAAIRIDQIEKERGAQAAKTAEATERGFLRATGAVQTTMDSFIDFAEEQNELFGVPAGAAFGWLDKLTPPQLNKFKDAFGGAAIEGAAQIGRLAISGARAVRLVEIFKKSQPRLGGTMVSNINNAATSMRANLDRAIDDNARVFDESVGQQVPIRDVLIDDKSGKKLSQLPLRELVRARNDIARKFGNEFRNEMLVSVYNRNPKLLDAESRQQAKRLSSKEQEESLRSLNDAIAANEEELAQLQNSGV